MLAIEYPRVRPTHLPFCSTVSNPRRWAVILAGGDGLRLRPLTRFISGDDRPKQFCRVLGGKTLCEQALSRAERSIARQRTILALTAAHEAYYDRQSAHPSPITLLQPCNRGTAPAIILSLLHIVEQDPDAMVAVLPSDHYYSDEAAFTVALESAFHASGVHHDSVILLGARPSAPEIEFGWIRVGSQLGKHLFKVRGFEEKPALREAERLFREGALWNTFVMVGRAINFLWMSFCSLPELVSDLMRPSIVSEPSGVLRVSSALYSVIPTVDFCSKVLTPNAFRLLAMPLNQVEWHDLGREDRVIKVAQSHKDKQPGWIQAWNRAQASMN